MRVKQRRVQPSLTEAAHHKNLLLIQRLYAHLPSAEKKFLTARKKGKEINWPLSSKWKWRQAAVNFKLWPLALTLWPPPLHPLQCWWDRVDMTHWHQYVIHKDGRNTQFPMAYIIKIQQRKRFLKSLLCYMCWRENLAPLNICIQQWGERAGKLYLSFTLARVSNGNQAPPPAAYYVVHQNKRKT